MCTIQCQKDTKPNYHLVPKVFLTAFHSFPSLYSASQAPLHPEFDDEAIDNKMSLRAAAPEYTQTQNDLVCFFLHISFSTQGGTRMLMLNCVAATVIDF